MKSGINTLSEYRADLLRLEEFGVVECLPLPFLHIPYPEFERLFRGREVEVETQGNHRHFKGEAMAGLWLHAVLPLSEPRGAKVTL